MRTTQVHVHGPAFLGVPHFSRPYRAPFADAAPFQTTQTESDRTQQLVVHAPLEHGERATLPEHQGRVSALSGEDQTRMASAHECLPPTCYTDTQSS